jgi:hypothetical protein
VSVYRKVKDVPTSGTLTSATASRSNAPFGLQTVALSSPVLLQPGEKYAVVVQYTFAGSTGRGPLVEMEREYASATSATVSFTVDSSELIRPGQSYLSSNARSWQDVYQFGRSGQLSIGNLLLVALSNPLDATTKLDGKQPTKALLGITPNLRQGNIIIIFDHNGSPVQEHIPLTNAAVKVSGYDHLKPGLQTIQIQLHGHPALQHTIHNVVPQISAVRSPASTIYLKKSSSLVVNSVAYDNVTKMQYPITYKSSNTKVLTVDSSGRLTAKSVKKTTKVTVTATAYNKSKKISVYVVPKAKKLSKAKASVPKTLKVKQTAWITVNTGKSTNIGVSFSSSKPSVLKVDKYGQLTAVKKGTAKITVKEGSKKYSKTVTVK